jgi:neutral ceramidase
MYLIGTGKADITAFIKGVGMLGYGIYYNTMEAVETPLSSRAFVFCDTKTGRKVCFVNCELAFITVSLKKGVLRTLERRHPEFKYDEDNLMLTAQHTHSGPGGYNYYGFYNLSVPGFSREIYVKLVEGIAESIIAAEKSLRPGKLSLGSGTFELDKEVAFQRSLEAYNCNPEVQPKLTKEQLPAGLDREMLFLKATDDTGKDIGSINWFGVHTTSLPNTNKKVCYDNKGYAADYLEDYFKQQGNSDYLGIFAQGTCGDVTPRFRHNPVYPFQRGQYEGKYADDFESARYNGRLQFEKAKEITESPNFTPVEGDIDYEILFVNFSDITADPKFTNGVANAQTDKATLGVAFFTGTVVDGPGLHPFFGKFVKLAARVVKRYEKFLANMSKNEHYKKVIERKYRVHGNKDIMVETHTRRVLGTSKLDKIIVPGWLDPSIATFKFFFQKVGHIKKPWTPKVMPLQLTILGDIALAGFPFEITTIAGKRLRKSLEERLAERGVKRVILCPYANDYSGYITTYEEYQAQIYEGGHTVFGEWSLAALQTKFDTLAKQMMKPKEERVIPHDAIPPDFTEDELNQFPFYKRAWYIRQELIRARRIERKGQTAE